MEQLPTERKLEKQGDESHQTQQRSPVEEMKPEKKGEKRKGDEEITRNRLASPVRSKRLGRSRSGPATHSPPPPPRPTVSKLSLPSSKQTYKQIRRATGSPETEETRHLNVKPPPKQNSNHHAS
ncbi:hypothetical protein Rs2_40671 [Raphanus sativus]|nr:hypothetical protein Rs2_40671 [Raphanus sativus]